MTRLWIFLANLGYWIALPGHTLHVWAATKAAKGEFGE